ncbi:hypothetical protein VIGAN_10083800 [Vigna angularis var. angularis]|uniref:Uncharacterized protein n=1 Tax=Vigna angularis var. angularis TaxID=157739 RepID=A0A0S3T319_PHAAN|nr:hypothetical protein VIGAN_10083800 [Vigna angularis var. angularis]
MIEVGREMKEASITKMGLFILLSSHMIKGVCADFQLSSTPHKLEKLTVSSRSSSKEEESNYLHVQQQKENQP